MNHLFEFLEKILLSELRIDDGDDLVVISYIANTEGYYVTYRTWHDPRWTLSSVTIYNSQLIVYSKIL